MCQLGSELLYNKKNFLYQKSNNNNNNNNLY